VRQALQHLEANQRAHNAQQQQNNQRLHDLHRQLASDPFNVEVQKAIEEEIRLENVNYNMERAIEETPEAFGRVIMLYIDSVVNSTPVKAFVDTGAQSTIMSEACAERCGIMRLVDRRFSGIAKGVGTAPIIGRVHAVNIKIGNTFFPCSFTILERQDMDFILGLDMLRRHQCNIDLHNNQLVIGSEKVPFLAEKDLQEILNRESAEEGDPMVVTPPARAPTTSTTTSTTTTTSSTPAATHAPLPTTPQRTPTAPQAQPARPAAPQHTPTAPQPAQPANEEAVRSLMELGATRQEAVQALTQYRGNLEFAAGYLFGGGF